MFRETFFDQSGSALVGAGAAFGIAYFTVKKTQNLSEKRDAAASLQRVLSEAWTQATEATNPGDVEKVQRQFHIEYLVQRYVVGKKLRDQASETDKALSDLVKFLKDDRRTETLYSTRTGMQRSVWNLVDAQVRNLGDDLANYRRGQKLKHGGSDRYVRPGEPRVIQDSRESVGRH